MGGHILTPKRPVEMHYTRMNRRKEPSSIQKRKPETMVFISLSRVTGLLHLVLPGVGACLHLHFRVCERIYREGCAYVLLSVVCVCVGCGAAVAFLGVSACVFLLSPSVCVSRDRSLAYPSSPRRSRRGGHSKQTQNSHPHAYTLFGGMPIADLRWGRCGLQMPQTHACTHTHAPFPSSEAAKTHSDSSEAEPPPCSMELPSLPHTHKYTFSCSLSHLIFYLMVASVS